MCGPVCVAWSEAVDIRLCGASDPSTVNPDAGEVDAHCRYGLANSNCATVAHDTADCFDSKPLFPILRT